MTIFPIEAVETLSSGLKPLFILMFAECNSFLLLRGIVQVFQTIPNFFFTSENVTT